MWRVSFTKVEKQLRKLPDYIKIKVLDWAKSVEEFGMPLVRRSSGLHDEPLRGARRGQRSIRLNRSWRLIYEEKENGEITLIEVREINHHDY
ncbi:MAG: type II toxin-antitoxin system RelE family toxin [Bacteriovoracia bacterium]